MQNAEFISGLEAKESPAIKRTSWLTISANLFNIITLLAFLCLLFLWVSDLSERDSSQIPVVRAPEGPMRVQPENPGGRLADNQGFAVNRIAAEGGAAAPSDSWTFAPTPITLSDEDQSMSQLRSEKMNGRPRNIAEGADDVERPQIIGESVPVVMKQVHQSADSLRVSRIHSVALDADNPVSSRGGPTVVEEPTEQSKIINIIGSDVPGIAVSLFPRSRPSKLVRSTVDATYEVEKPLEVSAADVPAGTQVVQLGAFESAEVARAEWDRLRRRFGGYLVGKQRIVQIAVSGGRTFYRLRALGFDDLSDGRRFCSALVAEGADCIPVVTR